jgi:hypothetical protein
MAEFLKDPEIPNILWTQITELEQIGRGATAVVSRGVWRRSKGDEVPVALKKMLLPLDGMTDPEVEVVALEIKLTRFCSLFFNSFSCEYSLIDLLIGGYVFVCVCE